MKSEALGRTAFAAFCEAMRPYLPPTGIVPWEKQPAAVKQAWIAAALAAAKVGVNELA
jgi:hypothetical protein